MMGFSRKEWAMLVSDGEQQNAPKKGGFRAALFSLKIGGEGRGTNGRQFPAVIARLAASAKAPARP
jgi:hypothetical protein